MSSSEYSDSDNKRTVIRKVTSKRKPVKKPAVPVKKSKEAIARSESDSSEYEDSTESEESSSEESSSEEEEEGIKTGSFDLPTAKEQAKIWVLTGVPASGKSHMMKYVMYLYGKQKHFKGGILVFSPSAFNGDYDFLPKKALRNKFDENYLEAYVNNLQKKVEEGKEKNGKDWRLPHNALILDDCIGTMNSGGQFLMNFFSCHRHTSTTVFVLNQYLAAARSVSTCLRNVTSFALCWPQSLEHSVQAMYKAYGRRLGTLEEFEKALDKCREKKYSCLLFIGSNDIKNGIDQYRYITAGKFPDFQLDF